VEFDKEFDKYEKKSSELNEVKNVQYEE